MKTHILIVDPDPAFASVISQGLEALAGYQVTVAASGQEALEKLDRFAPVHLAILDLSVGDIPPPALIDALRAHTPALPVLAIPVEGSVAPMALPVQGAFTKPPFLPDLPPLIERALGREAPARPAARENARHLAEAMASLRERYRQAQVYPGLPITRRARLGLKSKLSQLSQTLDSVPVLLTQSGQLIARAGGMNEREARQLARTIDRAWATNGLKAGAPEMIRFEEFLRPDAFDPFTVYSTVVVDRCFLTAAWRGRLPLVLMRQQVRAAAREIARLLREEAAYSRGLGQS